MVRQRKVAVSGDACPNETQMLAVSPNGRQPRRTLPDRFVGNDTFVRSTWPFAANFAAMAAPRGGGQPAAVCAAAVVAAALVATATAHPLEDSTLGLNEVAWHSEPSQIFLGSPSILRVRVAPASADAAPSTRLLATADRFGSGFAGQPRNVSLYASDDNGETWQFQEWIDSMYWSNLFQLGATSSDVYLLGTSCDGPSPIKITKSSDGGVTWPDAEILFQGIPGGPYNESGFETGPTPALLASDGRVYRAMELFPAPHVWGASYQAVLISASQTADLLEPSSWTISQPLPFNKSWMPSGWDPTTPGYLEGNAVEGPNGEIFNVLRFNSKPMSGNIAVILQYMSASNTLVFRQFIDLPGGHTKFVIRRDPVTQYYLTLSNNNTDPQYQDQRNILCLCFSKDVVQWTDAGVLLHDDTGLTVADSVKYTGFHYTDWQIDGDDLMYLVRTAYRGAVSYHNSNRITYKRLANFRAYLPGGDTMASVAVTGTGWKAQTLRDGATAYSNRDYVWTQLSAFVATGDLAFTQLAGGASAGTTTITISKVAVAGAVYCATDPAGVGALADDGWTALDVSLARLAYTDAHTSQLPLLRRVVNVGDTLTLPQQGWAGSILIYATS